MPAILYVDDDAPNLAAFRRNFEDDFTLLTADGGAAALALLERNEVGVIVSDQRMPEMTGVELLTRTAQRWPLVGRMLLTAYSDRELLLDAIQRGQVHDYVLKPWNADELRLRLQGQLAAFEARDGAERTRRERDELRRELRERNGARRLVGSDGGLRELDARIAKVAGSDASVLIRGESGTGKELVAWELHQRSRRASGPFIRVNCAAFSEGVLESELFGHEAGAFTGAKGARAGRFEQAHGGTLFLDEIGDLPPSVQVKLLRVVQERELERVGGNRTVKVDIRLLAATHRDLERMVQSGAFRNDLFFRLNVVPLQVPPLRRRAGDVEKLAAHFLDELARELGKKLRWTPEALALLSRYDWPGNVRELRNVVERAAVLADDTAALEPDDLVFDVPAPPPPSASTTTAPELASVPPGTSIAEAVAREEEARLRRALHEARGSKARAARLLDLPRTTLNDRLRKYGIE